MIIEVGDYIVSLFVWVIIVLALPKVSTMLARIIYPVEAEQVVNLRKHMSLDDLQETYKQKSKKIHKKYPHLSRELISRYYFDKRVIKETFRLPREVRSVIPLDEELAAHLKENEERINNEIGQIVQSHKNKMNIQILLPCIFRDCPLPVVTHILSPDCPIRGPGSMINLWKTLKNFRIQSKRQSMTIIFQEYMRAAPRGICFIGLQTLFPICTIVMQV